MMTYVWCELVCRTCARSESGQFISTGRVPVRSMVKEARGKGWLFRHSEAFCSQKCLQQFEDKRAKEPQP